MLRKLLMLAILVIFFGSCRTAKTAPYVEPVIGLKEPIETDSKVLVFIKCKNCK